MDAVQQANSGHPGHADGHGAGGLRALAAAPALRPRRPDLAGPRPLRAVDGPRLDAALLAAAPRGREGRQPEVRDAGRARRCRSTTSSASASSTAAARAIPSTAGPRGSRPPPGPLGQGVATSVGHGHRRRSGWPRTSTGPASRCSASTSTRSAGDGCMMEGISRRGGLAGRPPASSTTSAGSTTTTASRSRATPRLAFSEDVATRFIGYGWNVTRVGDANDLEMLDRAFDTAKKTTDRPTLIIVDSHIGYGAPTQAGHPRRPRRAAGRGGDQAHQALLRLAGGREVPGARRRARALRRRASARAGAKLRGEWMALFEAYKAAYPEEADALYRMQHRQLPEGWDKGLPDVPRRREGRGRARRLGQGAERRRRRACPGSSAARPTSRPPPRRGSPSRARATSRPGATAGATSTSASASTRWARS